MKKPVLVTDLNFSINRRFVELYGKNFSDVIGYSPVNRPDMRSLRMKDLVFVGTMISLEEFGMLVSGIKVMGSLTIYTNSPLESFVDLELVQSSFKSGNRDIASNPELRIYVEGSDVMSSHELYMFSDAIEKRGGEKFYSYCRMYMGRSRGYFSYDVLKDLDPFSYCGGRVVNYPLRIDRKIDLHVDFLNHERFCENSGMKVVETRYQIDDKWDLCSYYSDVSLLDEEEKAYLEEILSSGPYIRSEYKGYESKHLKVQYYGRRGK